jgi:hypothetical protein
LIQYGGEVTGDIYRRIAVQCDNKNVRNTDVDISNNSIKMNVEYDSRNTFKILEWAYIIRNWE